MELTRISLNNYRCFQNQSIDFSKITLLLGPNSGGKTSLLSALLSALQSKDFPLYFSPNGDFVETGDFREIVASHVTSKKISIALNFKVKNSKSSNSDLLFQGNYNYDSVTSMPLLDSAVVSGGEMNWTATQSVRANYKILWKYDQSKLNFEDISELYSSIEKIMKSSASEKNKPIKEVGQTNSGSFTIKNLIEIKSNAGFSRYSFRKSVAFYSSLSPIEDFKKRFAYLGSHRSPAQRTYFHKVSPDLRVGVSGQNAVEQILYWKNTRDPKLEELVLALKKMGLAKSLKTNKLSGGRFEVRVTVPGGKSGSSLADVGFGVNQFLPILVCEAQMPKNSTIAISQPETHLHPSVQADMATNFVDMHKAKGFRYIVETHSEYVINRFRRHIRKGDLKPEDVAVYYFEPSQNGTKIHKITLGSDGRILGAPKEFFNTYQLDVLNIALKK